MEIDSGKVTILKNRRVVNMALLTKRRRRRDFYHKGIVASAICALISLSIISDLPRLIGFITLAVFMVSLLIFSFLHSNARSKIKKMKEI